MKAKLILILISLTSIPVLAEELDLKLWHELEVMAKERSEAQFHLFPAYLQPVTTKEGVFQQVFNYQMKQLAKDQPNMKFIQTSFEGGVGGVTKQPTTTFEFKPIDTRASINIENVVRATVRYQVFSRSTEVQIKPVSNVLGMNVGVSHLTTPSEQRNQLVVSIDW